MPLRFPGGPPRVQAATDSRLLAWASLGPRIASLFDCETGPVVPPHVAVVGAGYGYGVVLNAGPRDRHYSTLPLFHVGATIIDPISAMMTSNRGGSRVDDFPRSNPSSNPSGRATPFGVASLLSNEEFELYSNGRGGLATLSAPPLPDKAPGGIVGTAPQIESRRGEGYCL
ncbi:MAG: hypothetical protein RIC87_08360 [Kiloniellales bacterium]